MPDIELESDSALPPSLATFGSVPLVVTIQGGGHATGKTSLQFLLASFLEARGHEVFVSDASASGGGDDILAYNLQHRVALLSEKRIPCPVFLHVTKEISRIPSETIDGHPPRKWPERRG